MVGALPLIYSANDAAGCRGLGSEHQAVRLTLHTLMLVHSHRRDSIKMRAMNQARDDPLKVSRYWYAGECTLLFNAIEWAFRLGRLIHFRRLFPISLCQ